MEKLWIEELFSLHVFNLLRANQSPMSRCLTDVFTNEQSYFTLLCSALEFTTTNVVAKLKHYHWRCSVDMCCEFIWRRNVVITNAQFSSLYMSCQWVWADFILHYITIPLCSKRLVKLLYLLINSFILVLIFWQNLVHASGNLWRGWRHDRISRLA